MRLLYSLTSPYARKIRALIREIDILDRVEEQPVQPMSDPEELLALNPLGKVPVLVTGDTTGAIVDSPVIAAYLVQMPSQRLTIPVEGDAHWQVKVIEAICDGVLDAAISLRNEHSHPQGVQNDLWVPRYERQILHGIDSLPARLTQLDAHMAEEDRFTYAHICAMVTLEYLDLRHSALEWRRGRSALADFHAMWAERPSLVETRPPAGA